MPRGDERELAGDRDRVYELDGDDSRALAAVGAFRIAPERDLDLPHDTLETLHDQRLVELVDLGESERGLTLTTEGRDLLNSHSLERDREPSQMFHAGVSPHGRWTTTRICMRRFDKRRPVFETSTLTLRFDASFSSKT